jgi:hypothetical protein
MDLLTASVWLLGAFLLGVAAGATYRPARGDRND